MSFFAPLTTADPSIGGKARSLARLLALGLPVPAGFAITDRLFLALAGPAVTTPSAAECMARADTLRAQVLIEPWPSGFLDALNTKLAGLIPIEAPEIRFSVRSSFAREDDAAALGAGVYDSYTDVAAVDVPAAVRKVVAAALRPAAVAYALGIGADPFAGPYAVLVHTFVAGQTNGMAALPIAGDPIIETKGDPLPNSLRSEIVATLDRVVAATGPSEIEWTVTGPTVTYLQWRPFAAPKPAPVWVGFQDLPPSESPGDWRWDAAHNPAPLSAAQAGLVAWVDERCRTGLRQTILGGYLFYKTSGVWPDDQRAPSEARAAFNDLAADVDRQILALGASPLLAPALHLYAQAYERLYGVIQPAARRARALLVTFLRTHVPDTEALLPQLLAGVPSVATERRILVDRWAGGDEAARAAFLEKFGDESGAWDVSAPTWNEVQPPMPTLAHIAQLPPDGLARAIQDRLPRMARGAWKNLLPIARDAAALQEDDDWLFARLQATVRRALLVLGRRACDQGYLTDVDQIFDLPLSIVRDFSDGAALSKDAGPVAHAARLTRFAARAASPPFDVGGISATGSVVRGLGTGGRVVGTIHLFRGLCAPPPAPGAVLLATTLLPTELPLIQAAALVIVTGGALDHVAAQARERGLPAVVGATNALSLLADGDQVLVDADAGLVVRLSRR